MEGDIIKVEEKDLIKQLIKLFKPFKLQVLIVVIIITFSELLSMLTPIIIQHIMDDGLITKNINLIIKYSLIGLVIVFCTQLLSIIEVKYRTYIENMLAFYLEYNAFRHVLNMNMNFFWSTNYSEIMDNLKTDVNKIASICDRSTFFILTSIFRIAVG